MDAAQSNNTDHALTCEYCGTQLVVFHNPDIGTTWAECPDKGPAVDSEGNPCEAHSFWQDIVTPIETGGRTFGYALLGVHPFARAG